MPTACGSRTAVSRKIAATPIRLCLGREITETVKARISYAFKVFAAIYNYRVLKDDSDEPGTSVFYGATPSCALKPGSFSVPTRYVPENIERKYCIVKHRYANEEFPLSFGLDEKTGNPDWLGEIFVWLSSSHEFGEVDRDSVGRIPYEHTPFGRQKISARKPYATLLMSWLESRLRKNDETLCKAPSPVSGIEHMVICSHDIDFYYTNRRSALFRLLKNLAISFRLYRSWSFLKSNSVMILELLNGRRVGDYLPALLDAIRKAGFHSTLFVVVEHRHRRDPNYRLPGLFNLLSEADKRGCSICVHGSYTSAFGNASLHSEVSALEKQLKKKPLGSRQHWLRFDTHENLFDAIENAELLFDSTLGFPNMVGFRNGASFAFPPYNFREERPYKFLEIPLVLMDGSLESETRVYGENAQEVADQVLQESRKLGWGGVAVLWHNPIEPLAVPEKINQVFWKSAEKRAGFRETWMSAHEFLRYSLARYQEARLLEGVQLDA